MDIRRSIVRRGVVRWGTVRRGTVRRSTGAADPAAAITAPQAVAPSGGITLYLVVNTAVRRFFGLRPRGLLSVPDGRLPA
ncbi:hypothetical protein ACFWIQ_26190 [Kitasatospora sp. NPDC127059]|uniref:hypothetical protein n=1 Tax=unclassified Kitasatospora TaxID=2633591 RepID=UPI00366328BD